MKAAAVRYPHIEILDHVNLFDVETFVFALLEQWDVRCRQAANIILGNIKKYKQHIVRNPT